jgi:hypothetical protein
MSEIATASTARPARIVYVSEDDLARVLDGETIELHYGKESVDTVTWAKDPARPLTPAIVDELRGSGANCRLFVPGCDKPFMALVQIGAPPNPREGDNVHLRLSVEAYRVLCGLLHMPSCTDSVRGEGVAWRELRRQFPVADYVREPSNALRIDGIVAESPPQATQIAKTMIDGWLTKHGQHDVVYLAAVADQEGRYSVTALYHIDPAF